MGTSTQIGDSSAVARNGAVASIPVTTVALTQLTDKTSFLNTNREAGKVRGAQIQTELASGVLCIFIADGPADVDVWFCQRGTDADSEGNDVTPA